MDELRFYVLPIVFQSYQDCGRVSTKSSVQSSTVKIQKESRLQQDSNLRGRDPKLGALTAWPHGRFQQHR